MIRAILLSLFFPLAAHAANDSLFVEAEAFTDRGGWTIDTQFILIMGSAYLNAHGLGTPVDDASTTVTFPSPGTYHLHVRTKDWVATWDAPGSPGKFQVSVGSQKIETTFGTQGADWHWHNGGSIEITEPTTTLTLHDLTGFNGRCDAFYFTKDATETPPNDPQALFDFRRQKLGLPESPPTIDGYDLVVVGGGYSGLGTAISAARQGLKVALVNDRAVLGGNGSSEIQVWAQGGTQRGPYPHLGEIVDEFADASPDSPGLISEFGDEIKQQVVDAEPNIDLYLQHFAFQTNTENNRILSVDLVDTTSGDFKRLKGRFFADTTGHGTIGAQAGASYMMADDGRMGMSNMWSYREEPDALPWPETPWALPLQKGDYPPSQTSRGPYSKFQKAEWFWESGFDKHPIDELEKIRDWNLRANFGAFTDIKRSKPNAQLKWMALVGGTRESRRLEGDLILTGDEIVALKEFDDACVPTTWTIDLHYPKKEFHKGVAADNPFIAIAVHERKVDRENGYPIPYRCFYSKDIENLFMAGRCISVDRRALGTIRVMRTCGMMGEVVGKAAWIAVTQNTSPRGVYQKHLPLLIELMEKPGRARRVSQTGELIVPPIPEGGLRRHPRLSGQAVTPQLPGLVVDDSRAKLTGTWKPGTGLQPHHGGQYQYASAPATATYPIRVKEAGRYEVRFHWLAHENRTPKANLNLTHAQGQTSLVLDQTSPPENQSYTSLGIFEFNDVLPGELKISHEGPGFLHIDALQLIKVK